MSNDFILPQIWRFTEDKRKFENVKSHPVPLHNIQNSGFFFSSEEAYLLLLIYKAGSEGKQVNIQYCLNS